MLPQAVFSTKTFYAKSYPGTVALGKCCAAWVLWRAWCCHHMRAQTFDQAMVLLLLSHGLHEWRLSSLFCWWGAGCRISPLYRD
mmetsp:Transcript_355/g.474  ORF Transcript_355/g.474 Transcript_355/m.474 type:complete len:84 (+) Transcript_355:597-848(+)